MSDKLKALAEKVEALRAEIVELDAVEDPTEEQAARFNEAISEFDTAKSEHDAELERQEKINRIRNAPIREAGFAVPNVVVRKDPFENLDAIRTESPESLVSRAVTAVEDTQYRGGWGITDAHREAVVEKIERVPGVAAYALAVGSPAYLSAFRSWLSSGGQPVYTDEERNAVRASLSLTSANGGYSLPMLLDPTLIYTGTATKNPIRRLSRVVTGTQNVWHGVTAGAVTTAWKSEGSAFTDGSPTFGGPTVTAANLTAYVTASYEIFQDSNLQAELPGLIAEAIDFAESTAFVTGSGSGAPTGVVTAISATVGSTVTATTRGSFTSASAVDVFALLNSVAPRFEESVTWVANKATFNTIRQMSTGSNGSLFWTDLGQATPLNMLGSPVASSSDMPSATTSGNVLIVLGDFSRFIVFDRIGTSLEFIPNVVDGSGVPTGQRGLVAYKRVGSNVVDVNAFRFLKM